MRVIYIYIYTHIPIILFFGWIPLKRSNFNSSFNSSLNFFQPRKNAPTLSRIPFLAPYMFSSHKKNTKFSLWPNYGLDFFFCFVKKHKLSIDIWIWSPLNFHQVDVEYHVKHVMASWDKSLTVAKFGYRLIVSAFFTR